MNLRKILPDRRFALVPLTEHIDVIDVVRIRGDHEVGIVCVPTIVEPRERGPEALFVAGRRALRTDTHHSSDAYISARKWLTVRSFVGADTGIELGSPRELFDASAFGETTPLLTPSANAYAAALHGRRFLAAVRAGEADVPPIQLIVNWRALLRR